ncbi:interferon alpha-inducible protein 27-like protein 2B [Saccostrea echinata]|uniref:interferon alpha-inducible protein 27-like protein 2B n=1 Tax=Saccostrea echinata TaxID=191078 RepID=UPI002A8103C8|nr:interferon alpha-inducible protein 27-like protein 2B [Saccostrea echinata]
MAGDVCKLTLWILCLGFLGGVSCFCPKNPKNGSWHEEKVEGRCILRCEKGFEPSNCHVIRFVKGKWNSEIPECVNASWISGKTLVAVGTGVAAVVSLPLVLTAAGFTATGVAAGSLAAGIQTSSTAAGGLFAGLQSAGVLGTGLATKIGVGGVTAAITNYVSSAFSGCEQE